MLFFRRNPTWYHVFFNVDNFMHEHQVYLQILPSYFFLKLPFSFLIYVFSFFPTPSFFPSFLLFMISIVYTQYYLWYKCSLSGGDYHKKVYPPFLSSHLQIITPRLGVELQESLHNQGKNLTGLFLYSSHIYSHSVRTMSLSCSASTVCLKISRMLQ